MLYTRPLTSPLNWPSSERQVLIGQVGSQCTICCPFISHDTDGLGRPSTEHQMSILCDSFTVLLALENGMRAFSAPTEKEENILERFIAK